MVATSFFFFAATRLNPQRASAVGPLRYRIFSRWDDCYLADLHDHCVSGAAGIVYKRDETNTNADHDCIMSAAAGEALDRLQTLAMAEWGLGVYVTDAWDGDGGHSSASVHYEGRAVDLAAGDGDLAKMGRLASLAVVAGFEWSFNEVNHVHASVAPREGDCVLSHSNV